MCVSLLVDCIIINKCHLINETYEFSEKIKHLLVFLKIYIILARRQVIADHEQ